MNIIEVDYSIVKCRFCTVLVYLGDQWYFSELVTLLSVFLVFYNYSNTQTILDKLAQPNYKKNKKTPVYKLF